MNLSSEDRSRIHAATVKAEAETQARFAAVILPASDRYRHYPLVWGAALALMVGAGLALVEPHMPLRDGILIEGAIFAAFALVFDWFPLRLLLVPKIAKHQKARDFAHHEFATRILSPSDRRDGILLFVSLGERYVEILATRAIHTRVGDAAWDLLVAEFVAAAKADSVADGVVSAVEDCATHLSTHFPKAS